MHTHAQNLYRIAVSRDLVEQEGTNTGGNLVASNPPECVYRAMEYESEVGGNDKERGEIIQGIAPENVYSTVDEAMVIYRPTNDSSSLEYHHVS